jgi:hypothetical protein
MVCPQDKHATLRRLLQLWDGKQLMSLGHVETATGMFQWLSAGFSRGKADAAYLIHVRTAGKAKQARTKVPKARLQVRLTAEAMAAIHFWHIHFAKWDRTCPIFQGFTPTSSWERLGRVDASTEWGCGGWIFDGARLLFFVHEWTQEERKLAFVKLRESTGALELMGARRWIRHFEKACTQKRVQLELDSAPAVLGLAAAYSAKPVLMDQIVACHAACVRSHIILRVRHVVGTRFKIIADLLSHNQIDEAKCRAKAMFQVPVSQVF